jgi:hypothetical protein
LASNAVTGPNAAAAESVIEKVKLPHKLDKMLYRVHKIIR